MDGESLLHTTRKRMSVKTEGGSPREQEKKNARARVPPPWPGLLGQGGGKGGGGGGLTENFWKLYLNETKQVFTLFNHGTSLVGSFHDHIKL